MAIKNVFMHENIMYKVKKKATPGLKDNDR